ncbi:hypothetical protein SCB49_01607 [unidentified eubacterium SCB49]|nr:hypothetical protein SCB49_01607 [unidentified eubacterium SCB49]
MKLRSIIYQSIPKKWRKTLGASKLLKPFRDFLLREKGSYIEETVVIKKTYSGYNVNFKFVANIQVATKAIERGIESSIINKAIFLLKKHKPKQGDSYTVFDVGANFGYLGFAWKQSIAKKGSVYSFEPHPNLFSSIKSSVLLNKFESFYCINKAVGKNEGIINLHLSNATSNTLSDFSGDIVVNKSVKIKMTSLDAFVEQNKIKTLDLIKIDVDGIEHNILEGAKKAIVKYKPIIIVETNNDVKIHTFLRSNGYKILDMNLNECIDDSSMPLNSFGIPI